MRRSLCLALLLVAAPAVAPAGAATLVSSAARTSSSTASVELGESYAIEAAVFQLAVTAAATDVDDTLDVYVQQSVDGGTTWDDFVHFTQVLGNGGAKVFLASWQRQVAPESELKAPADAALAAGVLQGPVSPQWRVKWVVVDSNGVGGPADGDVSFTFSVTAQTLRASGR